MKPQNDAKNAMTALGTSRLNGILQIDLTAAELEETRQSVGLDSAAEVNAPCILKL